MSNYITFIIHNYQNDFVEIPQICCDIAKVTVEIPDYCLYFVNINIWHLDEEGGAKRIVDIIAFRSTHFHISSTNLVSKIECSNFHNYYYV